MTTPIHAAVVFALALALPFARAGDPTAEFDEGLARCRTLMSRGKWTEARDAIVALARSNDGAPHAAARRAEVRDLVERAAFRAGYAEPEPRTLTSGKVLSYNAASRRLKIAYDAKSLGDFERASRQDEKTGRTSTVLRHPVRFTGPYTIDVRTTIADWGKSEFTILFNIDGERYHAAALFPSGTGRQHAEEPRFLITRIDETGQTDLEAGLALPPSPRAASRLAVGRNRIDFSTLPGKKAVSVEVPIAPAGGFGFVTGGDVVAEIVAEGPIDPSWFRGLADAAETAAFEKFRSAFDPGSLLPPSYGAPESGDGKVPLPDLLSSEASALLDPVLSLASAGKHDEAIAALDALAPGALPEATREFVGATSEAGRGRYGLALERAERVLARSPAYLPARRLKAHVLLELDRAEESAAEFEKLLADFPSAPEGYAGLAVLHVRAERIDAAEKLLAAAEEMGVRSGDIEEVADLLRKAKEGPKWERRFVKESPHYRVATDLSEAVAAKALRILMQAHREYCAQLERPEAGDGGPARVFLFSSEAGYEAYAAGIGSRMEGTAGVYNPALRQLLVWNQPNEGLLHRTIRHEGFHQYFHRVAAHRPVWLDEGLAEYFETGGDDANGTWREGGVNRGHAALLKANPKKLVPLEDFFAIGREAFYATPETSYAQAWAVAHFLRQDERAGKPFFAALFARLVEGATAEDALNAAFSAVTLADLTNAFARHLAALTAGR